MASSNSWRLLLLPPFLAILLNTIVVSASSHLSQGLETSERDRREGGGGRREEGVGVVLGRRVLMSFKETPSGGNVTFDCSPSGPCVGCLYSEKNDDKYRCSETGYRIPLKCVDFGPDPKETNNEKIQKTRSTLENTEYQVKPQVVLHDADGLSTSLRHRSLLDDSSMSEDGKQAYITYRSCIPAVNEEKLSVLGFEGIMLCMLLLSGSAVYFRRKRSNGMLGGGAVRIPNSSRF